LDKKTALLIWKLINFLFGVSLILIIVIIIRMLIYLLVGIPNDRVFRSDFMVLAGIFIAIIITRVLVKPYFIKLVKSESK